MSPTARIAATLLAGLLLSAPAAGQDPGVPSAALLEEGRDALRSGDLALADTRFRDALTIDPELAPAWLGASLVAEHRGDAIEALGLARQAARVAPGTAAPHLALGRLLAALGRTAPALEALAKARQLGPNEPLAYRLAALLLRDGGRGDKAVEILEDGLATIADAPAPMSEELAGLYLAGGEPERALRVAEAALERFPARGELHLAHGLALMARASDSETIAALEEALRLGLDEPVRAHLALAETLTTLDRAGEALKHLEAAARLQPDSPEVHYRLGNAHRRAGDAEGARAALERFRELSQAADRADHDAKKRGTTVNEAQELVAAGRPREALARLDELLAGERGSARALNLKAKILFSLGDKEAALDAVDAARGHAPGIVESHVLAGMFLMDLGRAKEAETALLRALDLDPAFGNAHALLGSLAAASERPQEAVDHFDRALALGADGIALRLRYAEVLHSLGRVEESKRQLEVYRALMESASDSASAENEPG